MTSELRTKRSIPDDVLDKIVKQRPHLKQVVTNLRNGGPVGQLEKAIADNYLMGEALLTGPELHALGACCSGRAYGSDYRE